MRISIRLNELEEKRLNELQTKTGLSITTLVKKGLFDDSENLSKTIIEELGKISTNVNLTNNAVSRKDLNATQHYLTLIEKGVDAIWQSL